MISSNKSEYGDFQTPEELATRVALLVREIFPNPPVIVEPTCGLGNFIKAALPIFNKDVKYYGFDVNEAYVCRLKQGLMRFGNELLIEQTDFFEKNWKKFFSEIKEKKILVIGNPPWVTNSALGTLKSRNIPSKSNFQRLEGFAAKTGKANFDIAEWILIKLIESLKEKDACVAMLCKTATARKVLRYLWKNDLNICNSSLHIIDARKYFHVSVEASLFITYSGSEPVAKDAVVYSDLSFDSRISKFGIYNGELIADIDGYRKYQHIDGTGHYKWRSGVKHDASKVMELSAEGDRLVNGFGENADIEKRFIYPLLKSSDIANNRLTPKRYVILTQKNPGDDTSFIKEKAPLTWAYLEKYADILDKRKSIIYKKRPRFSVFGIGNYSFSPWKVAVSGLYKTLKFSVVGSASEEPIMLDDTCYFISCYSESEALFISELLNSEICQGFLKSLIFFDAKRPINVDILNRIDLKKLSEQFQNSEKSVSYPLKIENSATDQLQLMFGC